MIENDMILIFEAKLQDKNKAKPFPSWRSSRPRQKGKRKKIKSENKEKPRKKKGGGRRKERGRRKQGQPSYSQPP